MSQVSNIVNIEQALAELAVNAKTLSAPEKKTLDEQGFIIFPNLVDKKWLEQLRAIFEKYAQEDRNSSGYEGKQERGTRHLPLSVNQDPAIERLYTHPKLLASIYHILKREFRLREVGGRDPLPGFGKQGLHADWYIRPDSRGEFDVVNSFWMLDDFTPTNGATRLVPGSHREFGHAINKKQSAPDYTHPKQVLAVAPAGSLLVFNAHILHSGTLNQSKNIRRAIHCFYLAQEFFQMQGFEAESGNKNSEFAGLSPAIKYLLGI
jgi:Phytanoyl-CoA dioxygenase (PhyH)